MSHEVVNSQRQAELCEVSETCRRGLQVFLLGVLSFVRSTASHALDWAAIASTFRPPHISEEVASQIWQQLFSNPILDPESSLTDATDPSLNAPSPEQLSLILQNLGQPLKSTLALLQVCSRTFPHVHADRKAPKRPLDESDHPLTATCSVGAPNKRSRTPSSPPRHDGSPHAVPLSQPCSSPCTAEPALLDSRRPLPAAAAAAAAAACGLPTLAILSPNQSVALTPNSALALSAAAAAPPPPSRYLAEAPRPSAARPAVVDGGHLGGGLDPKDSEPESDGEVPTAAPPNSPHCALQGGREEGR